jgi:hypothetical protein
MNIFEERNECNENKNDRGNNEIHFRETAGIVGANGNADSYAGRGI